MKAGQKQTGKTGTVLWVLVLILVLVWRTRGHAFFGK